MTIAFDTAFTRLVGIEFPIVQAPIGGLARPALASAVSNAGALGMLALSWSDLKQIEQAVAETRSLTRRPFGVNLVLAWPQEERLRQVLALGVRIVSFFWGDPTGLARIAHDAGAIVLHTVGSADDARRAVDAGVDFVVAQGWESGGHVWGSVASLPLIPAVVDAVAPTPVVAAGGIGDGRGLAAVLALGASAGWLGSRFVLAAETRAHPTYRDRMLGAAETSTVHSVVFDGGWPDAPHRTLRNSTFDSWEAAGRPTTDRPGEGDTIGVANGEPILRYSSASPHDGVIGDAEPLSMWAGQSIGVIREIRPAAEIVATIAAEASNALATATGLIRR
jgi:nitronate monooxygenase